MVAFHHCREMDGEGVGLNFLWSSVALCEVLVEHVKEPLRPTMYCEQCDL